LLFLAALLLLEATYRGEKPRRFGLAIDHGWVLAKTRATSFVYSTGISILQEKVSSEDKSPQSTQRAQRRGRVFSLRSLRAVQ
jgi:hypothetical protein